jgi:hypothetical protein
MEQVTQGELEARKARPARVAKAEVVSNMNDLRTGQLMDMIEAANREVARSGAGFLKPGKRIILAERNPEYLEEILAKMLPVFCPRHLVSYQEHHLPHYVVHDGRVELYKNLDTNSPVAFVQARVKHPCSLAEKVSRKAEYFGRISEFHKRQKLMVGDVIGIKIVVGTEGDIGLVGGQLLALPYLRLEHFEKQRKENGFRANQYNMTYDNGNSVMKGLELEVQVTDRESHYNSIYDPKQGHDTAYGAEKLGSPHRLPADRQLVIVGNSVNIPRGICDVRRAGGLLAAQIEGLQPYTLIVPRGN